MTTHLLKLVAVIIAVCIPGLAFGEDKTVPKTQIREAYFTINLPKGWIGGPGSDSTLWQYASPKQNEQLSVSIHISKTPISKQERPKLLNDFLAMRLKSETDQAKSKSFKISEPKKEEKGNAWVARYSGVHPEARRRFANFTVVNPKLIANFYYEALDMTEEEFEKNRKQILTGVGVAE